MPRAVLKNGVIHLTEPLPPDWHDGTELSVEKCSAGANGSAAQSTDEWMNEVEALAARVPAEEDAKLMSAIAQLRREAKDLARKGKR